MPESCFMHSFRFNIFSSPALNHSLFLSNEISLVSLSSCEIVKVNAFPTSFKLCCRNKKCLFTFIYFWCCCVRITISNRCFITWPSHCSMPLYVLRFPPSVCKYPSFAPGHHFTRINWRLTWTTQASDIYVWLYSWSFVKFVFLEASNRCSKQLRDVWILC